ncbi:MAG: GreA/GreB family elongation factor [Firmicutes bacterium]|nr:GreA/GreB family elongation factor [Bacillota bacterium]
MQTLISQEQIDHLNKQLLIINDRRKRTIEQYFSKSPREQHEFNNLIDNYVNGVKQFIQEAEKASNVTEAPFVFIGCTVQVKDVNSGEIMEFHVVDPLQGRVEDDNVSYLSPVGRALLLKKVDDEIKVKTPGGNVHYKILAIKFRE